MATTRDQKSLRISRVISRITIQAPIRLIAVVSSALGQPNRDAMPVGTEKEEERERRAR